MNTNQPMASAPLRYDQDGQVDWGAMWGSFCALAAAGGPPQQSRLLAAAPPAPGQAAAYQAAQAEIIRGIGQAAGLSARPHAPGWIAVACDSPAMAEWLAAAGQAENVAVQAQGSLFLVPCGAHFTLKGEIKAVITLVAKLNHYWADHRPGQLQGLERLGRRGLSMDRRAFLRCSLAGLGTLALAACGAEAVAESTGRGGGTAVPPAPSAVPATDPLPGFADFAGQVTVRMDDQYVYVESDGMPGHGMMRGIRSWQQQVPLPQPYRGANSWRIPRQGVLAEQPISARTSLYRGAIALAVNGVPIFNALNNRGDDALLAGELDEWGGHAGRADDYHYHVAPLHLQALLSPGAPIAYALDGFPIYGLTEPDGAPVSGLDEFNGHVDGSGNYHYHASQVYPYINGGLRGVVQVRDDQVDPQPQATPIRPDGQPLPGASITAFQADGPNAYSLAYQLDGQTYRVSYRLDGDSCTFTFTDPSGASRSETYDRAAHRRALPSIRVK